MYVTKLFFYIFMSDYGRKFEKAEKYEEGEIIVYSTRINHAYAVMFFVFFLFIMWAYTHVMYWHVHIHTQMLSIFHTITSTIWI